MNFDYEKIVWQWMGDDAREKFAQQTLKNLADECANDWQDDEPLDRHRLLQAFAQLKDSLQ
jgi:hypothetical protein